MGKCAGCAPLSQVFYVQETEVKTEKKCLELCFIAKVPSKYFKTKESKQCNQTITSFCFFVKKLLNRHGSTNS